MTDGKQCEKKTRCRTDGTKAILWLLVVFKSLNVRSYCSVQSVKVEILCFNVSSVCTNKMFFLTYLKHEV